MDSRGYGRWQKLAECPDLYDECQLSEINNSVLFPNGDISPAIAW
jgi:hypothetical protein